MSIFSILILALFFFIASIISVISGSTSLITVPVMLVFGIEPRSAIATNMFALTLMSVGGTLPFIGKRVIDTKRLPLLIVLTLLGSLFGALLVFIIPSQSMPFIIFISMIVVTILSVANPKAGVVPSEDIPSRLSAVTGYVATFILGIYGGFFSGGYVTLLTTIYILLFRMSFIQAIATTKFINIFSSLIATLIFMQQGIVNYQLSIILGMSMFIGGAVGSYLSLKLSNVWLQRIYLVIIITLSIQTYLGLLDNI
jgi:uncharacterized membrane protein YfcA